MIDIALPAPVQFVLNRLKQKGYPSYIVGGAVRDRLLEKNPTDMDILTRAGIDEVRALFPDQKVRCVGRTFPVCRVNDIEVASPRQTGDSDPFPESDLGCRDFTVNAMAWCPERHTLIDPFQGRVDLDNRVIRFTRDPAERVDEDPVRMVRACRFSARIGGTIEPASMETILLKADQIKQVPGERIKTEVIKAMAMKRPSLFFDSLRQARLLKNIFPSLDRCFDLDGGPHHNETVFEHCMLVGDALPAKQPWLRLAGFLHDTGKFDAARMKDNYLTFAGHETCTRAVETDLERLRVSGNDLAYILSLIRVHMRPLQPDTTPKAVRRLLARLDDARLDVRDFLRMRIADRKGNLKKHPYTRSEIKVFLKKTGRCIDQKPVLNMNGLAISGNRIMRLLSMKPGPEVGRIKQYLFERVLDRPELNTPEQLAQICLDLQRKNPER